MRRLPWLFAPTVTLALLCACDREPQAQDPLPPDHGDAHVGHQHPVHGASAPPAIQPTLPLQAAGKPGGPKIYLSADMEGVAGVVTDQQLGPGGFEYERFRGFMTAEVRAAIEAAYQAGASEVVVSDSHGNGQNLLIEQLPPEVVVIRSWPRPLGMMEGIDDSFAGVLFIGYHTGSQNPHGVRAHTMSSANLTDVRLHGRSMSEAGINAAIAGQFGVPVIMVSGDDACVTETRSMLGDIEGAVVKWHKGFHSAETLTPAAAQDVIRAAVTAAIARIDRFRPHVVERPIEVEVDLTHYRPAEILAYLPVIERTAARTVRYRAADMAEASRFLRFITSYEPGLTP